MKDLHKLKKDLDAIAGSLVLGGPTLCAQKVVADLQQVGPQWTGRFSNSWQIRGPQGQTARGDGQPGKPRPIVFQSAPFTGLQAFRIAYRTFTTKDKVVFTISNFSPYSDQARDLTPFRPEQSDEQLGDPIKKPPRRGTRPDGGRRGELAGGRGPNKATAILDWYSHYLGGGQINKTIQVTMDGLNIGFR
jgi:hypothetical protein